MKKILTFIFMILLSTAILGCKNKTEEPEKIPTVEQQPTVNPSIDPTKEETKEETKVPTAPVNPTTPVQPTPTVPQPTEPKPTEPKPTEPKPTEPTPTDPVGPTVDFSTDIYEKDGMAYHVVGGYQMDWAPTDTNMMEAVSLAEVAKYSVDVATHLKAIADDNKLNALYMAYDYVLDVQPENASMAPAIIDGQKVLLNQGFAIKCIRAYFDELDEVYVNDRWISDPKVAHTETLTPETLFMPKWVELPAPGEEDLGKWDDNPMCIAGSGIYVVLVAEYKRVSNATTPGFGLALFKVGEIGDEIPTLTELETPTVSISKTGVASWAQVANASGYAYKINDGAELKTTELSVQLNPNDSIVVKALGDGETYDDSKYSDKLTYVKELVALSAPTVAVSSDGLASWAQVANASGYVYQINDGEEVETTELSVQLRRGDIIVVKALGDGVEYKDSDYCEEVKYDWDLSGVVFESLFVEYDGNAHTIICENLPEGIIVTYLMNSQTEPGAYQAVAILWEADTLREITKLTADLVINPKYIPATGYCLLINGETYVALTQNTSPQDPSFEEHFVLNLTINAGDVIKLYNAGAKEEWVIQTPDSYSDGIWTGTANGIVCGTSGTYNVYVKIKFEADQIYFGKAQ